MLSCSPISQDDYRQEGEKISAAITKELKGIHKREDLIISRKILTKFFNELVDVMIESREYQIKHPEIIQIEYSQFDHSISDQLRLELNRVYRIDGARQILEKCQETALNRLDAYEKKLLQRRNNHVSK